LNTPYSNFAERVSNHINHTASIISLLSKKKFLAWGASAKGAVMMNAIHNRWPALKFPSAVIDQTPEKQGLLTPGLHIPVIAPPDDLSDVDVIWILSWNWLERLRYEAETRGFKGRYLVTSPKPKLFAPESYMSLHK
jgi:C-methyltransferase C-terminal domain